MMKLGDQVCSLELAKRLKELGAKQESLYLWIQSGDTEDDWSRAFLELSETAVKRSFYIADGYCSAFTVAELGEMLPFETTSKRTAHGWCTCFTPQVGFYCFENIDTEVDARAQMLIYLLENKLVKP